MNILTIQVDTNKKINVKNIKKQNPKVNIIVINYGRVTKLEQYDIAKAINTLSPLLKLKESKGCIVIEARFRYFFGGEVSEIEYTTTLHKFQLQKPFWITKKYMLRSLFHYAIQLYIEDEVLLYDTSFKQEIWKFYDHIIEHELYKNIFTKTGPREYSVIKSNYELGFYRAHNNPFFVPLPEPASCKNCLYYANSAYLRCTVNPFAKELCRDYEEVK